MKNVKMGLSSGDAVKSWDLVIAQTIQMKNKSPLWLPNFVPAMLCFQ